MSKTIDKNLRNFVQSYVNSLVVWAVIVFYHQNPGVRDRIPDLARHLGRREEDVEKAVEHLLGKNLLKKEESDNGDVFSYDPSPKLSKQVEVFVSALDSRDLRLWVLSEVLEN